MKRAAEHIGQARAIHLQEQLNRANAEAALAARTRADIPI